MVAIIVGSGLGLDRSSTSLLGGQGQIGSANLGRAGIDAYVNAATGNLVLDAGGETLTGRGPDAAINRTYNSRGQMDDDNGDNWASVLARVQNLVGTYGTVGSTVDRLNWDGSVVTYSYNATLGAYAAKVDEGAYDIITSATGPWTWTDGRTGVVERYDPIAGGQRVTQRKDRDGNTITFAYSGALITRVTMADGSYSDLVYTGNNLTSVTTSYKAIDPDTRVETARTLTRVRYGYDPSNRLTSVTVDLSPEDGSIADGRTYVSTYTYDGTSRRVASIAQTDGSLLTLSYDGSGRVLTFTQAIETGVNRTTSFSYGAGVTTVTDPLGQATNLYHDSQGRLTRKDEPAPVVGGNAIVTTFAYNSHGALERVMRFDGSANIANPAWAIERTDYSYDGAGNVLETVDGSLRTHSWTYNSHKQVITETSYTGIDPDGLNGALPTGAMTTRYAYDTAGRLRFIITPEGRVTEHRYNGFGQQTSSIDYAANTYTGGSFAEADLVGWVGALSDKSTTLRTDTSYDFRGNVAMETNFSRTDIAGNGIRAADFAQTLYVYDQAGNLLSKQASSSGQAVSGTDLANWAVGNLSVATASPIWGKPAKSYTIQTGGAWSGLTQPITVVAGDVITASLTLQGVGQTTQGSLGVYGGVSQWGANGISSARIIAGPGTLTLAQGGLWRISGLSTTQPTRIEVSRLFSASESGGVYLYPDDLAGQPSGSTLIVSDPVVVRDRPSLETYAYDGLGRVVRFTDAKGVGTWTTYLDAQSRTLVTTPSGLSRTTTFNRAGELTSSAEAGLQPNFNVPADLNAWAYGGVGRAGADKIDGSAAFKYTAQTNGQLSWLNREYSVVAGSEVTLSVSLQAVSGSATTQSLGLWANSESWGSANVSTARIISGPGTLVQAVGGLWQVLGLSTTEPTRIEISRTYLQSGIGGAYVYVDNPGGFRAGQAVLVSAANLVLNRYDITTAGEMVSPLSDVNLWGFNGLTRSAAANIGSAPATQVTVQQTGQYSAVSAGLAARAGDTFTATMSFLAVGAGNSAAMGIYGNSSGWDSSAPFLSTTRIISGPGTLFQQDGGFWNLNGLSDTVPTRVEFSKTFQQAESGGVYVYPEHPNGWIAGRSLIIGAASVQRTAGAVRALRYDATGQVRIIFDPLGIKTFFFYDRTGRKIGEVDGTGSVTEYKYDAAGREIARVAYATQLSAGQIASLFDGNGNPTSVTFAAIRPGAAAADRWNWTIYDNAGRVIETIDPIAAVTACQYDGAGRLIKTTRYNALLTAGPDVDVLDVLKSAPPTSFIQAGWDQAVDRSVRYFYDNDGNQIGKLDEDAFFTEFVYDQAGRRVETIRYANAASVAYLPGGAFNQQTVGSFAQVKASIATVSASDVREYALYDGRGLLGAQIDGEGNVTRYHYTPRGDVAEEVRGQKVAAATLHTLATLPAATGSLEITKYTRDALGNTTSRIRQLSGGHTETTVYSYDNVGNLLSEVTSETVSAETRGQSFRYDGSGRLIASLNGVGSYALSGLGASPSQAQIDSIYSTYGTRYEYDADDRLIAKWTPHGSGAIGNRTVYFYDANGNLRFEVNALGEVKQYIYNSFDEQATSYVYGTRLTAATVSGLVGGLVSSSIINAVSAIANTNVDTRTETSYTTLGQISVKYSPLYWINPYIQNYDYSHYNSFRDLIGVDKATGATDSFFDVQRSGFFRRGLKAHDYQYRNNSSVGSLQNSYSYDSFGRVRAHYLNNTDWRYELFLYDRAGRQTSAFNAVGASATSAYDPRNNIVSETDRNGKTTTFSHDLFSRNVTTTTAEGITSSVKRNAYGQTIQITDGASRTKTYSYDKDGNLKTVTDAAGTVTNHYDNADRLIEIVDARNTRTRFTYDAADRILTRVEDQGGLNLTTSYTYDAKGQQISVSDPSGTVTTYAYDLKGAKVRVVKDAGAGRLNLTTDFTYRHDGKVATMIEGVGSAAARTTSYVYDSIGRLLETHVDPAGLNLTTKYTYDNNNNLVAVTDERGNITRNAYDLANRLAASVNMLGEVTTYGFDAEGRVIRTTSHATRIATATMSAWNGNLQMEVPLATVLGSISTDAAKDRTVRTLYDGDGRLTYEVDAEGYVTRSVYDGANNLVGTIRYATAVLTSDATTKAGLDNLLGAATSPPATAAVTSFGYDSANRLIFITDARGYTEYYQLDANGNRTRLTNKSGGITDYTYDALGQLRYEHVLADAYRSDGTLQATGYYKTIYEYDSLGNVSRLIEAYGLSERRDTSFSYDTAGRRTGKTLPQVSVYNPATATSANVTPVEQVKYDERGNIIETIDAGLARTLSYYDAANRKIVEIGALGTYTLFAYDAHGNLSNRKIFGTTLQVPHFAGGVPPAPPSGEFRETIFAYDADNRLIETRIPSMQIGYLSGLNYTTSTGDLISSQIYDAFGNIAQETDARGHIIKNGYDRRGFATSRYDQDGYFTVWQRDGEGNVLTERRFAAQFASLAAAQAALPGVGDRVTRFTYDRNGRRLTETREAVAAATVNGASVSVSNQDSIITYLYNGLGQVTRRTEATGDATDYAYDAFGRQTRIAGQGFTDHNGANVVRHSDLFYDGLNNLVRERNWEGGTGALAQITAYTYGAGGRLTSMVDPSGVTHHYSYDIMGRIRRDEWQRLRAEDPQVTQVSLRSYDLLGRLVGEQAGARSVDWHYGDWIVYGHNAYGDLTTKSINGVTVESNSYDGAGRVTKTNAGDGVWKFFVYDANGNATLTLTAAGGTDVSGYTQAGAFAAVGGGASTHIESLNQSALIATISGFDRRNLHVDSLEPNRTIASGSDLALTTTALLHTSRWYNAFGEVKQDRTARGHITNYSYNTMGRLVKKESPETWVTLENGGTVRQRPTENQAYDRAAAWSAPRAPMAIGRRGPCSPAPAMRARKPRSLSNIVRTAAPRRPSSMCTAMPAPSAKEC